MPQPVETKIFEIRDRGTYIPVLVVELATQVVTCPEYYYLSRHGWNSQYPQYLCFRLDNCAAILSEELPLDRTLTTAFKYIAANWLKLLSGAVIDVEYILGETKQPKRSERFTCPL